MRLTKLLLAASLLATPAYAGNIVRLNGGGTGGTFAGATITANNIVTGATTVDIPPHSMVINWLQMRANAAFTCPNDSAGNAYTAVGNQPGTPISIYACINTDTTNDLPVGSTFGGNSSNGALKTSIVQAYANINARDTTPTPGSAGATGTAVSITQTGSTTCSPSPNCSLTLVGIASTGGPVNVVSEDANFTTAFNNTSSPGPHIAERITSSPWSPSYSVTLSTSGSWALLLLNFSGDNVSPPQVGSVMRAIP